MTTDDKAKAEDAYRSAEYYDCDDGFETLRHKTPAEALEAYVDNNSVPLDNDDMTALLDTLGDITVGAYDRAQIDVKAWQQWGLQLVDTFADELDSEYAEGCDDNLWSRTGLDMTALANEVAAVLRNAIAGVPVSRVVWNCNKVGERVYTRGEVEVLLRVTCPQWFVETDAKAGKP